MVALRKGIGKDLNYLATRMAEIAREVDDGVGNVVKETVSNVVFELAEATPVDTGLARSNWITRVGAAAQYEVRPFAPGKFLGRGETGNLFGAQVAAEAAMIGYKTGQTVYVANNLPYLDRLNAGHSKQSAAGFVQRAVARAADTVRGMRVLK